MGGAWSSWSPGRGADGPGGQRRMVEVGEVQVPRPLPVVGLLRREADPPPVEDVEPGGQDHQRQGGAGRVGDAAERGARGGSGSQMRLPVWCSSSTISPPLKTRTAPVVWETVMATAAVSAVMAAAALWRAPRPSGTLIFSLWACRERPAASTTPSSRTTKAPSSTAKV